ncbi:MAG: hypothetical protein Q7T16_04820 [Candidatus Burarchaeum sp.]|nr:hypothetical protein [Candidatus Burarchaeum sp.]MDO8339952.1 hypothetical protein [Candidatus Burarchaeum sp.]
MHEAWLQLPLELDILRTSFPFVIDAPLAEGQINGIDANAKAIVNAKQPPAEPGLAKGNGHGPDGNGQGNGELNAKEAGSGNGGLGGKGSGNGEDGSGKKRDEMDVTPKAGHCEVAYPRARPPRDITVVDLMEAASARAKCIRMNGHAHAGSELNDYLLLKDECRNSTSGKTRKELKDIAKHVQFLTRALMRIDSFSYDVEAMRKREHERLLHVREHVVRKSKEIENFLLPHAIKGLLNKIAFGVLSMGVIGEAANFWQNITNAFWPNFVAFAASTISLGFILASYGIDVIKAQRLDNLAKFQKAKTEEIHGQCDGARRMMLTKLALALMYEFDAHYQRDRERQREAIANEVRHETGRELCLGMRDGRMTYAADEVLADALAEALCKQVF